MRHLLEVRPGSAGDPDGAHAAAVLAAFWHLEEVQDSRRCLYRYAAMLGAGALVGAAFRPETFRAVLVGGLGAIAVVGALAAIIEYRAASRLKALIQERRAET